MKTTLAAVLRITVVLFVGATLSMQHGTFLDRITSHSRSASSSHLGQG